MLEGVFSAVVKFFIPVLIVGILLSGISGQALSDDQQRGFGQVEIDGDFAVTAHFELDPSHPDRIAAVILDFGSGQRLKETATVQVSLDSGATWQTCVLDGVQSWRCVFQTREPPIVEEVYTLKVAASS